MELLGILPYITLHTNGPQDIQPPQSMFIYTGSERVDMLAWSVPDIDFDVRDSSVILDTMLSARVSLSITNWQRSSVNINTRTFDAVLAALPLDSLVTLNAPDRTRFKEQVWRSHAQRWRQLRCVRLGVPAALGFREFVLNDNGEHECSSFPSLIKLGIVDSLSEWTGPRIRDLCDILKRRVEQGVPLKAVDVRTSNVPDCTTALQQLSALGVEVWGIPADERPETQKPSFTSYYSGVRDLFVQDDSDLDSNIDGYNDDGSEEGSDSDIEDFYDGFHDVLPHFMTEEEYDEADDVDFYHNTV